jgi:hypothetical protein
LFASRDGIERGLRPGAVDVRSAIEMFGNLPEFRCGREFLEFENNVS